MTHITAEARAKIDAHLDALEAELTKNGWPRERRRAVVDEVETQISDMLQDRADVTLADVDAVLARLDPPSAYASDMPSTSNANATVAVVNAKLESVAPIDVQRCAQSRRGALLVAFSIALLFLFGYMFLSVHTVTVGPPAQDSRPALVPLVLLLLIPLAGLFAAIYGTVLGWQAAAAIGRAAGRLCGVASAGFAALFYPSLIAWIVSFIAANFIVVAIWGDRDYTDRKEAVNFLIAIPIALVLESMLAFMFVWLVRGGKRRSRGVPPRLQTA